jgi:hypothetical protein
VPPAGVHDGPDLVRESHDVDARAAADHRDLGPQTVLVVRAVDQLAEQLRVIWPRWIDRLVGPVDLGQDTDVIVVVLREELEVVVEARAIVFPAPQRPHQRAAERIERSVVVDVATAVGAHDALARVEQGRELECRRADRLDRARTGDERVDLVVEVVAHVIGDGKRKAVIAGVSGRLVDVGAREVGVHGRELRAAARRIVEVEIDVDRRRRHRRHERPAAEVAVGVDAVDDPDRPRTLELEVAR